MKEQSVGVSKVQDGINSSISDIMEGDIDVPDDTGYRSRRNFEVLLKLGDEAGLIGEVTLAARLKVQPPTVQRYVPPLT